MRAFRCYSCRPFVNDEEVDQVLVAKFNDWRFGEYERPAESIQPLRELGYHAYNRTCREIWHKAEEFATLAKNKATEQFFDKIRIKYKNKTLYGQ